MLKRNRWSRAVIALATLFASFSFMSTAHAGIAPTAPTGITVSAGQGSLSVSWAAPLYSGDGLGTYSIFYSTDGTSWNTAATGISGFGPYTINGLTPGTPYYIRMTNVGVGGTSPYGYPWTTLYSISNPNRNASNLIVYDTNFGVANTDPFKTLETTTLFTRVKYHLQYDSPTVVYADADMLKWTGGTVPNHAFGSTSATVPYLRIPEFSATNVGAFTVDTNTSDLTVVSSNSALNVSGKLGRVEIWATNYDKLLSGLSSPGDSTVYDFDDIPTAGTYGSFQVHDVTNSRTVLAWNHWDNGVVPDIGVGPGTGTQRDWTFCSNEAGVCSNRSTYFNATVSINLATAPNAILNTTVSLSGGTGAIYRSATTLTATASTIGKITFYANNKKIPGCINIATAGTSPFTATCTWRPSSHNTVPLKATFKPYTGNNSTSTIITPVVGKRVSNR